MATPFATVTNPIALCAYVLCVVFGLLAKRWNTRQDRPRDRQLFYLAALLSVVTLAGGLALAWRQTAKPPASVPPAGPVVQQSTGDQSPNVNSSGSGSVSVQFQNAPPPPAQPAPGSPGRDPGKPAAAKPKP